MQTVTLRLVTIVTERSLRDRIIDAIHDLGASGHTLSDIHGEGSRGIRVARGGPSVKIETIVTEAVAERIATHVEARYFAHYSVILYLQNVEVLRGSKYAPHNEGV